MLDYISFFQGIEFVNQCPWLQSCFYILLGDIIIKENEFYLFTWFGVYVFSLSFFWCWGGGSWLSGRWGIIVSLRETIIFF